MGDILAQILQRKRDELAALRRRTSRAALDDAARSAPPVRGFAAGLERVAAAGGAAVIAEIKKASPSKGVIRTDFDPAWLAWSYARGGAACLSVLTDEAYFQGSAADLQAARAACALPVIRKDFLVDELQVLESRALGADCILLIAAALARSQLQALHAQALALRLDVLVEVHDAAELDAVLGADLPGGWLLGINNRDLRTFATRLETTLDLLPRVPGGRAVVTESGIASAADVARMRGAGVDRFLVGESLMREPDPGAALSALLR